MDTGREIEKIDVEKVFKAKNPGLYKWLPGFVLSYIKRVIHQDEMNKILVIRKDEEGIAFVNLILEYMGVKASSRGLENVPSTGPVIIASNHPLGGLDGMILISIVGALRSDVQFIVNDILTNLPHFGDVFVPVNKLGGNAKANLQVIEQLYASEKAVLIFPAGLCSRKIDGEIQDLPWNKSFVSKAQKYQHPIVPVFVKARNSNWFYNLSRFRTRLGIKANIEMFYLADEMFSQKGKAIELTFGKPITPELLDERYNQKEWADILRSFIYELETDPEADFAGFMKRREQGSRR